MPAQNFCTSTYVSYCYINLRKLAEFNPAVCLPVDKFHDNLYAFGLCHKGVVIEHSAAHFLFKSVFFFFKEHYFLFEGFILLTFLKG